MAQPTEEERLQTLEILRNSYEMYERSKAETTKVRKEKKDPDGNRIYSDKSLKDTLELMETMQADVKQKYLELGGKEEDLLTKKNTRKTVDRKALLQAVQAANQKDALREYMEKMTKDLGTTEETKVETPKTDYLSKVSSKLYEENPIGVTLSTGPRETGNWNDTEVSNGVLEQIIEVENPNNEGIKVNNNSKSGYDTIKLPSKGECYKSKIKEIEVSYLTAYDENLILSPNLYKNGTFLDHILKNKIRGNVNPDNLIQGDRDAIIIWLRASGYGNEYPVTMIDDKTGKEFNSVIDLSKLNYKKFKLKGDENGYFDFTLPNSGDAVKFKFLTNADAKKIEEMRADEDREIKITKFKQCAREMRSAINDNDLITDEQYEKIKDSIDNIENLILSDFDKIPETFYTHDLTNRLILSTISVNGITDRKEIVNYILNMNLKDAVAYRNYIIENEPGIDYNIKVKRPDSLGGGYIDSFLRLDQFIFVN